MLVRSHSCVQEKRPFSVLDLVDCEALAANAAFTRDALVSAFKRVGMWSLDPKKMSVEELSKGADAPAADVNLAALTRLLLPIVRKELKAATIVNGALSTAGHAKLLNSAEIIAALRTLETERAARVADAAEDKEEQDKRKAERAAEKEEKRLAVTARKAAAAERKAAKQLEAYRKAWTRQWAAVSSELVQEAQARLRRLQPSAYKLCRRF